MGFQEKHVGFPISPERVQFSDEALAAAIGGNWSESDVSAAAALLADGGGKFPLGVRTLPHDLVRAVQRERLIAAMLRGCAELGYRDLSVQDVLNRAGISRPTFYEHFENKEGCFLAAFDSAAQRLRQRVEDATAEGDRWNQRLRRGLEELFRFVETDLDAATVLIVEARASCPAALIRRDELLDGFATCIDSQARKELIDPPSGIAAAGIVGGIETLLYTRITKGQIENLESLLPSVMHFAVLPYEGHEAAVAELGAAVS